MKNKMNQQPNLNQFSRKNGKNANFNKKKSQIIDGK